MNKISKTQLEYDKFVTVAKRMLKQDLSTNTKTLQSYREQIVPAYNKFVQFVQEHYYTTGRTEQRALDQRLEDVRKKLINCLDNLKCTYELPNDLQEFVEEDSVSRVPSDGAEPDAEIASTSNATATTQLSIVSITVQPPTPNDSEGEEEFDDEDIVEDGDTQERERRQRQEQEERERLEQENQDREKRDRERREKEKRDKEKRDKEKRVKEDEERRRREAEMADLRAQLRLQKELLDIVNGQIRKPYGGDPLGLPTFLSGVEIAMNFADDDDLKKKLVDFVKGRLEGKAREVITDDITTIEALIKKLKETIRPENSKIIEGRMAAVRYSYSKQKEFVKETEELADALRRTLIIEGMSPDKANEITVDRTIQLCRKSATSDIVKSILGSVKFDTAKDVVAKLITSNDECVKDKQILRYQKDNHRGQSRGRFARGRGYQNNYNNRGPGNYYRNYNNYNNNNAFRGRGGTRSRGNGYGGRKFYPNNRYQGQQQQSNNGGWRVNQNQNVRVTQAGNAPAPQALMGGPQIRQIE